MNIKGNHLNRHINNAEDVDAANMTTLKEQLEMTELELASTKKEMNMARSRRDREALEELGEQQNKLQ